MYKYYIRMLCTILIYYMYIRMCILRIYYFNLIYIYIMFILRIYYFDLYIYTGSSSFLLKNILEHASASVVATFCDGTAGIYISASTDVKSWSLSGRE